jgi:hypothetical protein
MQTALPHRLLGRGKRGRRLGARGLFETRHSTLRTAAHWPTAQGYIAQIEEKRDDNGFLVVTLAYTYKVEEQRYVGRESLSFIRDEQAARFEAGSRERSVMAHYRPDKPQVSVLARQNMPS